ncbi:MAG: hypothetical protein PHI01_01920 [Candidatus Izemoplasmatales bacterium]|nr:hypothetical protein [Candidatus Izemoplasmatales bacterium]
MRLSDVLSKAPTQEYVQIEGFMNNKNLTYGNQRKIEIGKFALNYFCHKCADLRSFWSTDTIFCLGVDSKTISIDINLKCNCETDVQVWFLIESENDISSFAPKVRIIKKSERLGNHVSRAPGSYGVESINLEKSDQAFKDSLGIGSMVYLRIIYEHVTKMVADSIGLSILTDSGRKKPFNQLLREVDQQQSIIPSEFTNHGYTLFKELSEIIHGNSTEEIALEKYGPCRRLLVGILENIKNKEEIRSALTSLNWNQTLQE